MAAGARPVCRPLLLRNATHSLNIICVPLLQVHEQMPQILSMLRQMPLRTKMVGSSWVFLLLLSRYLHFGAPFLMASAAVLMISNLGTRTDGPSAYTVFNRDMRALPGQLQMDDFERELRHQ